MRRNMLKAAAMVAAVALAFGAQDAAAQQKLKVGFIYVGPVGDFGWSYQHDAGRKAVVAKYGDRVETTFVESVSEGPDAERVIEQLARSGHKLIFTTSFGFMEPTVKVAQRFPNVWFEHATGFKRAPNLATYDARASTRAATSSGRSPRKCLRAARSDISAPSRSPKSWRASTPSCSARNRYGPT